MDGLREQLVKRPRTPADAVKKVVLVTGAVILAVIIFVFVGNITKSYIIWEITLLALIAMVWGSWVLAGRLNVEYEYIICGGELSVDKIFNKKSRKTLCSLELRSAEGFYRGEKIPDGATVIDVCGEGERHTVEYSDGERGKTALVFTPDERSLELIKPYLPRLS